MGGFFLASARPGAGRPGALERLFQCYAELGFAAPRTIETEDYVFAAYPSVESGASALTRHPNGDFAFVCGTRFCDADAAAPADAALPTSAGSAGCAAEAPPAAAAMGHYALVTRTNGQTLVRLDMFGGYHLFYNLDAGIVATSFFAISSALDRLTLSRQSACEYVFNGVVSGNETLFREVALAPIGAVIRVGRAGIEVVRPRLRVTRTFTAADRAASLDRSMALLDGYFGAVARRFGDRVGCALSGGYDSRLMLGFLRRHGVRPRLYVYGPSADSDVRLAGEIARREGLALAAIDKGAQPRIPAAEFAEVAYRNFLAHDGYGWGGIFQNNAEIAESARRVRGNAVALNGGGGEIFRNFFYLPDRQYTIRELLWSFYSRFDPSVCTAAFDSASYYAGLEGKVMDLLGSDERRLPRPTVEWLYHSFRCRSWDGKVDSIAGRYGFTAMPYLERPLTEHASALRLGWKNHGAYEAELIRRADRRLAQYPSSYGHDFSGSPPLSRRLADYATLLRPPWLRRYSYRLRHLRRRSGEWPGYLAEAYCNAALPGGVVEMRRLFHVGRIGDADQFARILSLEYAVRHFGSRVKFEF
jgi:asparagine synthase (glutamine-hydrolysing)